MSHTIISADKTITSRIPTEVLFHFLFLLKPSDQDMMVLIHNGTAYISLLSGQHVLYSHLTLPSQNEDHGSLRLEHVKQCPKRNGPQITSLEILPVSISKCAKRLWVRMMYFTDQRSNKEGQCYPSIGLKHQNHLLWSSIIWDNYWTPIDPSWPEWCQIWN